MAAADNRSRHGGRHSRNSRFTDKFTDNEQGVKKGEERNRSSDKKNRRHRATEAAESFNGGKRDSESVIKVQKFNAPLCAHCNEPITDLPAALADRKTGDPIHFDCVLKILQGAESLKENEKIIYIGNGKFAVAYFENPHDLRHFTITKTIEWEDRDKKHEWRTEISGMFSKVR